MAWKLLGSVVEVAAGASASHRTVARTRSTPRARSVSSVLATVCGGEYRSSWSSWKIESIGPRDRWSPDEEETSSATTTIAATTIAKAAASRVELGLERERIGDIAPVGCQTARRYPPTVPGPAFRPVPEIR